jgi:hypothetical protein
MSKLYPLIKTSNIVCSTLHPRSYSVHSYESRKLVDLLTMSSYFKMSDSVESFVCKVHIICMLRLKNIFKPVMNNINFEFIYISIIIHLMLGF